MGTSGGMGDAHSTSGNSLNDRVRCHMEMGHACRCDLPHAGRGDVGICTGAPGEVKAAIDRDPVFESLRAACEAQYAHPRGEEARKAHAANVRHCTSTKLQDATHAAMANPMAFNNPVPLLETKSWLVKPNRGPAQAKGVIYYLTGGFNPVNRTIETYRSVPYYLKSLADDGWDVVRAKIPYDFPGYYNWLYLGGYMQTVQRRVAALHAEGYKHVVIAGHSVGGWMTMMAARDGIDADALLLDAPNMFGPRLFPNSGRPNPDFPLSLTEFGAALGNGKVPTVLMLPEDEVFEPPDAVARGQIAEAHFTQVKIPHLVIAKPPDSPATSLIFCRSSIMRTAPVFAPSWTIRRS